MSSEKNELENKIKNVVKQNESLDRELKASIEKDLAQVAKTTQQWDARRMRNDPMQSRGCIAVE